MATAEPTPPRRTLGIVLMMAAMLTVPLVDGLAKHLSAAYSPLFITFARYAVACLVVLPVAAAMHGRRMFPAERLGSHALRSAFLVASTTLYFLSIARIPLATAISTFFIGPIIAVALSLVLLKERMTYRKAISLALGFLGSIIILRPGGTMEPGILLALASGIVFAFYMIATRHAALESDPVKTLAFQCLACMLLLIILQRSGMTRWAIGRHCESLTHGATQVDRPSWRRRSDWQRALDVETI